jgi:hypothetical protein
MLLPTANSSFSCKDFLNITKPVSRCSTLFTVAGIRHCTFRNKSMNFTAEEVRRTLPLWLQTREAQKIKYKKSIKDESL